MTSGRRWTSTRGWIAALTIPPAAVVCVQCATDAPPQHPSPPVTATASTLTITASTRPSAAPAVVHHVTVAELGPTWRPGCPTGPDQLRRIELDYIGFDGQTHRGDLVVHQDLVPHVVAIFDDLYRLRYPIEKMRPVNRYPGAEDELSMEDNNTSAFNCRGIPGSPNWSLHAYGRAIDVNPLLNPYLAGNGELQPVTAAPYLDRNRTDPGLLHPGDPAVRVFTDRGWVWGGSWRSPIDYQHFELR